MRVKELAAFIREREKTRVNKEAGKPRPWTKDPIINKYRFCNVHREHDYVTRWLRTEYYPRFAGSPDVWFAAVVARLLNLPESLAAVMDCIVPFNPQKFIRILGGRRVAGEKNFNAAYIVSTNGVAMDKVSYIAYNVLNLLWAERKNMRPKQGDTLAMYHHMLMGFDGLGNFIAAQVVADLKYIEDCPLRHAADWWTFAASGPGSRRGLNRVLDRDTTAPIREPEWLEKLEILSNKKEIKPFGLHNQDLQNCLCEFDKYERARLGTGIPKQIYKEKIDG